MEDTSSKGSASETDNDYQNERGDIKKSYSGRDHSFVWQYCTKQTAFAPAKCNLCNQNFHNLHGTTTNLRRHLKVKHDIDDPSENRRVSDPIESSSNTACVKAGSKKRSFVWKYFTNYGHEAICMLCGAAIKTITTTTSCLRKHLYTKHDINENKSEVDNNIQSHKKMASKIDDVRIEKNIKKKSKVFTVPKTTGIERKNSSPLWKYMTRDNSQNVVNCKLCNSIFPNVKNATQYYNLKKHLSQVHKLKIHDLLKQENSYSEDARRIIDLERSPDDSFPISTGSTKAEELDSSLEANYDERQLANSNGTHFDTLPVQSSSEKPCRKKKELDNLLGIFLIATFQQPSLIDNQNFKNLIKALSPEYQLPSAKYITDSFMCQTINTLKEDISVFLQQAEKVALSGDIWTSFNNRQLVTISAHFVCKQGNLKKYVLNTILSEEITSCMEETKQVLSNWGIAEKIVSVVANPDSVFSNATKDHLGLKFLPCFSQTFNTAVIGSLASSREVLNTTQKVRDISKYFKSSDALSNMIKDIQSNNEVFIYKDKDCTEKNYVDLVIDNPNHWLTTYVMLKHFLNHHELVTTALCYLNLSHMCLVEEEIGIIRRMVVTLSSCSMAAEELSKAPSISMVIPMLKQLRQCLESTTPGSEVYPFTSDLITRLASVSFVLEKTFVSAAATILDPRFKKLAFSDCNDVEHVVSQLKDRLNNMESSAVQKEKAKVQEETDGSPLWSSFDTRVDEMMETTSQTVELERYTEIRPQRRDADPLVWWKSNHTAFPHLATLASQFLVIPATAVPYDGLFSDESDFVKKRRFIPIEDIDKMIFLHQNYIDR